MKQSTKYRCVFFAILFFGMAFCAFGQNRYALVIGNSSYSNVPALKNPVNDAKDIAAALKKLGYQVDLKTDIGYYQMLDAVDAYAARLSSKKDSEGFFWFAGHGVQIRDENFLLPVDVTITSESRVKGSSYSLNSLLSSLQDAGNKANVVILDACRNNPLPASSRNTARGLAVVSDVPADLFVMFSTAPGDVAEDGKSDKKNSPFAEAFLKNIDSTEAISLMAADVMKDTASLTNNKQRPFYRGSIISDKYYSLNKAAAKPLPVHSAPQPAVVHPQWSGSISTGAVTITSDIAGTVIVDGVETGIRVKAQGSATVSNVGTGETEVAVRGNDGSLVKTVVIVRAGETVAALVKKAAAPQPAPKPVQPATTQPAQPAAQPSITAQDPPPTTAKAYYDRGVKYNGEKNYDKAIADFTSAIKLDPKYMYAYVYRGYILNDFKNDYDKAIEDFNAAIKLDSNYATSYYNRALAYRRKGNVDQAIADYSEAIRINPKYTFALNNRGYAYFTKKEYDKAIADYTEAIKIDPKYALAYNNRGNVYKAKGETSKANADLAKAKELGF